MRIPQTLFYTLLVICSATPCSWAWQSETDDDGTLTLTLSANRDFERAENLLRSSKASRVEIRIEQGEYTLKDQFHINRSHVKLEGMGKVTLRLARNTQTPLIAIGTQSSYPLEAERIDDIAIANLELDGNRDKQNSEYHHSLPWIRNNGIDVRMVSDLSVETVTSNSNRSGGLVISWKCEAVRVEDSVFKNNYFDGVAYYDSENVVTVDCLMSENRGAGVSLDNAFFDSAFIRCQITDNNDVGVFARHSQRILFYQCAISRSGNWAMFLSHDEKQHGVFDIEYVSCQISENRGGLRLGSIKKQQSDRVSVAFCDFDSNAYHDRGDISTAGVPVSQSTQHWSVEIEESSAEDRIAPSQSGKWHQATLQQELLDTL